MRKLIFFLALLLPAANAFAGNGRFGIVAGLTSSATEISTAWSELNTKSLNKYHIGLTYNKPLLLGFSIQPGIQYNVKGAAMRNIAGVGDIDYKTGFVEVPVQLQWCPINIFNTIEPYVFAEPFIGYAVSNAEKMTGDETSYSWDNIKSRFEYGVGLGAGIELFSKLQVSVRYFWNMGSLYSISLEDVKSTLMDSKCSGISASVAFLF